MLKKINLQLLAEPAAGDPGSGGTPPAATPPAEYSTPPASVTFTADQLSEIDRITTERTTRASQAALKSYFQQQGMTEDQASDAIKVYKETNKSKLTPEAQAQIDAANLKAADALEQANTILIKADATVQASALQIRADRLETVLSMADISTVKVTDGKVDSAAVKTAIEKVLQKFPEWKADAAQPGFKAGADVAQSNPGAEDAALRKAMGLAPAK